MFSAENKQFSCILPPRRGESSAQANGNVLMPLLLAYKDRRLDGTDGKFGRRESTIGAEEDL